MILSTSHKYNIYLYVDQKTFDKNIFAEILLYASCLQCMTKHIM